VEVALLRHLLLRLVRDDLLLRMLWSELRCGYLALLVDYLLVWFLVVLHSSSRG